jgi:hypothetical protein
MAGLSNGRLEQQPASTLQQLVWGYPGKPPDSFLFATLKAFDMLQCF